MKKKMCIMTVAALSSLMMTAGVSAEETVDSLLQKYSQAGASVTSTSADVTMKADVSLNIPDLGMALDIAGSGDMKVLVSLDPMEAAITGDFSGSAMGEEGSLSIETYLLTDEEGNLITYAKDSEENEWTAVKISGMDQESFASMLEASQNIDISGMPVTYELAADTVQVNGADCYVLTTSMDFETLKNVILWAVDITKEAGLLEEGEEDITAQIDELTSYLDIAEPYAAGLYVNLELDIDTESYLPLKLRMDMDGSDWTNLTMVAASMLGLTNEDGSAMTIDLGIEDLYMEYVYDYDAEVSVTLPEEAKNAEVIEADADSISELASTLEEAEDSED